MKTITFGTIMHMSKGKKPKKEATEPQSGFLPYVDIQAFEKGKIASYANGENCLPCDEGDILIVCDGSRSGLVGFALKGYVGSTLAIISADGMSPKYLYYFLQSLYPLLNTRKKGTGTPHLDQNVLKNAKVYLPLEDEQARIVARIEEMFSQLESGVETLRQTKEQLAVYRQAVLKEAFSGSLTAKWRKRNSEINAEEDFETIALPNVIFKDVSGDENEINLQIPDSWKKVRLGEIFEVEVGSTPKRSVPEYWNGSIYWVSSGEVRFNKIYTTEETITDEGLAHTSTKVHPKGTVMLAMIGEGKTRGQAAVLEIEAAHNQNTAAVLVSKTPCSSWFVYYFLMLNYDHTRRVGSGNNQKALNKERVKALRIPFPPFEEQKVIVNEIESRLSVCDQIEQTVDTALQQAEALRQSILKKAFEGGL